MADANVPPVPNYYEPEENNEEQSRKKKKKPTKAERALARKKAELEFKKVEKRAEFQRELELSKATALKHRDDWEESCKNIKLEELRDEMRDWHAKMTQTMQQKCDKVTSIMQQIEDTHKLHERSFSTHKQFMDMLQETMDTFIGNAKRKYEDDVRDILSEFYCEMETFIENQDNMKLKCEQFQHAHILYAEKKMSTDYDAYLVKRDDRVCSEIEKRSNVRDAVVKKMTTMHNQLLAFVDSLRGSAFDPNIYENIEILNQRQKNFIMETHKLNEQESQATKAITDLQREIAHFKTESNNRIEELRFERESLIQKRKQIETEIIQERQSLHNKLILVNTITRNLVKEYRKLNKQGSLVLSLMAACRKLQTESEKVVPWGDFQEPLTLDDEEEEEFKIEVLDLKNHLDITDEQMANNLKLMKVFWRRIAIVEAQNIILEQRKKKLTKQHQTYINEIKKLLTSHDPSGLMNSITIENVLPTCMEQDNYCLEKPKKKKTKS